MNKDYLMISFATKDGKYDKYGKNWENNMKSLKIPYDIEYIDPIKPAKANKRLKNYKRQKKDVGRTRAEYLINKLVSYNKTIIWMDCDDGFIKKPILTDTNFDVGFVESEKDIKIPIMARLLVLNPTENTFHFLQVWDYLNKWDELEPVGGSHIRLQYARYICFNKYGGNYCNFIEGNVTPDFSPCLRINMNIGK